MISTMRQIGRKELLMYINNDGEDFLLDYFLSGDDYIHQINLSSDLELRLLFKRYCRSKDCVNPLWGKIFNFYDILPIFPHYVENEVQGERCFEEYSGPRVHKKTKAKKYKPDIDYLCARAREYDRIISNLVQNRNIDSVDFDAVGQYYESVHSFHAHGKEESDDVEIITPHRITRSMARKRDQNQIKRQLSRKNNRDFKSEQFYQYDDAFERGKLIKRDVDEFFSRSGIKNRIRHDHAHGLCEDLHDVTTGIVSNCISKHFNKGANMLENLIFLISALSTSTNTLNAISIIALYVKTHYNFSFTEQMRLACCEFFRDHEVQGGLEASACTDIFANIIGTMKSAIDNWSLFIKSPLFNHMNQMLCVAISIGFLPTVLKEGTFSIKGLNFLRSKLKYVQSNTSSFYEALAESVCFFVTRGYQAFKEGDIDYLFYSDADLIESDSIYNVLVAGEKIVEAGNLYLFDEQGLPGINSESEYVYKLTELVKRYESVVKNTKENYIRTVINAKLLRLRTIVFGIRKAQTDVKFKKSPFTIMITGPSSVGKSTINSIFITTICHANNIPCDDQYRCVINETDKYDTEIKPYSKIYTYDDWANLRPEKAEESPTRRIVDVVNNVTKNAIKADVDEKGQVLLNPDVVTFTTNVMDLHCRSFSAEPASIMRRVRWIFIVSLRATHRSNTGGLDEEAISKDPDAWLFEIAEVVIKPMPNKGRFRVADDFEFRTIKKDLSIYEACDFLKDKSTIHFTRQAALVDKYHNLMTKMCDGCNYCKSVCKCDNSNVSVQAGFEQPEPTITWFSIGYRLCRMCLSYVGSYYFILMLKLGYFRAFLLLFRSYRNAALYYYNRRLYNLQRESIRLQWINLNTQYQLHYDHFFYSRKSLYDIYKKHESKLIALAFGVASMSIGFMIGKVIKNALDIRSIAKEVSVQAGDDIIQPDNKPNVWLVPSYSEVPRQLSSIGCTSQQLIDKVSKSLYIFRLIRSDKSSVNCNAFPLCRNLWLIPAHMLIDRNATYDIELLSSRNQNIIVPVFSMTLTPEMRYYLKNDFCVIQCVRAGDQPNLINFLAIKNTIKIDHCYNMVFLTPDKDKTEIRMGDVRVISHQRTQKSIITWDKTVDHVEQVGYSYHCFEPTRAGMCMGTLVSSVNGAQIVGFHVGGTTNTQIGFFAPITLGEVQPALDYFENGVFSVHSSGDLDVDQYGISLNIVKETHPKSPINFLDNFDDDGKIVKVSARIFGSHQLGRSSPFTSVVRTFISEDVDNIPELRSIHTIPINKDLKKHWHKDLCLRVKPKVNIPPNILALAVSDLRRYLCNITSRIDLKDIVVLPHDAILAGLDGVYGIDSVNLNTSMGFPLNRPKRKVLQESNRVVKGISRPLDMPDYIIQDIVLKEDIYKKGNRCYPIFRTTMKDEPVKIGRDKRRLFEAAPFWYVYLMRKYYLGLCSHIMKNRLAYCTAVGANVHSEDWTDIASYLNHFGSNKYIAGDYKAFDKNMPMEIILAAFHMLDSIVDASGNFSAEDKTVMLGIRTDLVSPVVEFDSVIMQVYVSHCSGNSLTVIINNFANLIYMRCAYYYMYDLNPRYDFHKNIRLVVYGDDNVAEVSDREELFNHTSCSEALNTFGIVYTMADKEAESVPYITFDELEFLKRKFRICPYFNRVVAPLELSSLAKSLHLRIITKNCEVGPRQIMADIIINTFVELTYHGAEMYDFISPSLYDVVRKHNLVNLVGSYKSFDEMLRMPRLNIESDISDDETSGDLSIDRYELHAKILLSEQQIGVLTVQPNSPHSCNDCKQEKSKVLHTTVNNFPTNNWCWCDTKSIEHSFIATKEQYGMLSPMDSHFEAHAGREDFSPADVKIEEQVFISDAAEPGVETSVNTRMDGTFDQISHTQTEIHSFLARPIRIFGTVIPNNISNVQFLLAPWDLYLKDLYVKYKTNNYTYIRGRLNLKFEITGNPFRFGKFLVSYLPYTEYDELNRHVIENFSFIPKSQRQKLILNCATGEGGTMILPFYYKYNYLKLLEDNDWIKMGAIEVLSMGNSRSINSTNEISVNVTCYAWMTDVELAGPTNITTVQGAYEAGPISKVASAVANASLALTKIPLISPYMMVLNGISSITADIASMFGFSRPAIIAPRTKVLAGIAGNFSNMNDTDTCNRLTGDIKQEITVDPRTLDLGDKDEMSILNIVQIESFIGNFNFPATAVPGTLLFNAYVSPVTYSTNTNSEPLFAMYMTPSCVVSQTFEKWRGGIKFRFIAHSTPLFRGKLRIVYEPSPYILTSEPSFNTNYTYIMDLAETDDFTVCVHWCSEYPYLRCGKADPLVEVWSNDNNLPMTDGLYNGKIYVYVLHELSSPGDVQADLPFTVATSMCDDAMFSAPNLDRIKEFTIFNAQGQFEAQGGEVGDSLALTTKPTLPYHSGAAAEFGEKVMVENINKVFFGETYHSIRTLMKRYCHIFTEADHVTQNDFKRNLISYVIWKYFGYRGVFLFAPTFDDDNQRFNFYSWTYLHWYTLAFLGRRGGLRYKILSSSGSAAMPPSMMTAGALSYPIRTDRYRLPFDFVGTQTSYTSANYLNFYSNSSNGIDIVDRRMRPSLEFELPDYSGKRVTATSRVSSRTDDLDNFSMTFERTTANILTSDTFSYFVSTGEDFALFSWTGMPAIYVLNKSPSRATTDPYPIPVL